MLGEQAVRDVAERPLVKIARPAAEDRDASSYAGPPVVKLDARHITFHYGAERALDDVTLPLHLNRATAIIGPSGCGKSTLIRVFNRMYDLYSDQHVKGEVLLDGVNILGPEIDANRIRASIGMVFQAPAPFPMSIYNNVAYGLRTYETLSRAETRCRVEAALRSAALWDEVKAILSTSALSLSGGQQQRLCIARTIAMRPDILLLDEPCSSLDPRSAAMIEETIVELKADRTVAIVTHNLQQAARISDYTAFMFLGRLVEFDTTDEVFGMPKDERTRNYVTGCFG
ncbi:MAG TPA: phosphate ABC transporter ATP-binding protein [Caulobacteraceae bacterium]|nr:phosphate ABC transporter ATP-binding protein [Caulobacteraceae bacterium]